MNISRAFSPQLCKKAFRNDFHRICSSRGSSDPKLSSSYSTMTKTNSDDFFKRMRYRNTGLEHHRKLVVNCNGFEIRRYSSSGSDTEVVEPTEGEEKLKQVIKKAFPKSTNVTVEDISGGCGSMFQIYIEAPEFSGLSTVKQHRLVNEALKAEIQSMHGIRIQTAVPKKT